MLRTPARWRDGDRQRRADGQARLLDDIGVGRPAPGRGRRRRPRPARRAPARQRQPVEGLPHRPRPPLALDARGHLGHLLGAIRAGDPLTRGVRDRSAVRVARQRRRAIRGPYAHECGQPLSRRVASARALSAARFHPTQREETFCPDPLAACSRSRRAAVALALGTITVSAANGATEPPAAVASRQTQH